MDKAIEYTQKLDNFVAVLNAEAVHVPGEAWQIETGRKFDKVYLQGKHQKHGRYMVDRNSWEIFGIKRWAQINPRRTFGTLDVVNQVTWSAYVGKPKAGSSAERILQEAEASIASGYKKRGRPRKVPA